MPELPEVETMVAYLRERAIDGPVKRIRMFRNPYHEKSKQGSYDGVHQLPGQTLHTVCRRGKYMVFHFSEGLLVCHNAMSGYWDIKGDEWCFDYVEGARKSSATDVRFEIDVECDREQKTIRFHDARLFGSAKWFPVRGIEEIPALAKLGPEAIWTENADITIDKTKRHWNILDAAMLLRQKWEVKHALMEQEAVAGFGNIYAAEALFLAKINPFRIVRTLTTDEWQQLFESGQRVLRQALDRKLDYSVLWAYRQKDCITCEGPIEKKDLRGRSTYFCPTCQK